MQAPKPEPMTFRDWILLVLSAAVYAVMFWYGLVMETGGF